MSVYVRLVRPEGYEDVCDELVLEDAGIDPAFMPELVTNEIEAGKLVAKILRDHMKEEGGIPMSDALADAFHTLGLEP